MGCIKAHERGTTMEQQNVTPVNHGVLSSTGTVAIGTAGGAAKGAVKAGAGWIVGLTVLGSIVGAGIFTLATGGVGGLLPAIMFGATGGLVTGIFSSPFAGVIGAAVGGVMGAGKSVRQVSAEKGAANTVKAQVAVYQAQAEAMAASNDNKYQFPPQGSRMNQAGSTVNAMQADGRVDAMQLQRA